MKSLQATVLALYASTSLYGSAHAEYSPTPGLELDLHQSPLEMVHLREPVSNLIDNTRNAINALSYLLDEKYQSILPSIIPKFEDRLREIGMTIDYDLADLNKGIVVFDENPHHLSLTPRQNSLGETYPCANLAVYQNHSGFLAYGSVIACPSEDGETVDFYGRLGVGSDKREIFYDENSMEESFDTNGLFRKADRIMSKAGPLLVEMARTLESWEHETVHPTLFHLISNHANTDTIEILPMTTSDQIVANYGSDDMHQVFSINSGQLCQSNTFNIEHVFQNDDAIVRLKYQIERADTDNSKLSVIFSDFSIEYSQEDMEGTFQFTPAAQYLIDLKFDLDREYFLLDFSIEKGCSNNSQPALDEAKSLEQ